MKNEDALYIGEMDRLVQVIKKTVTKSTTGAEEKTDKVLVELWAERKMLSSSEALDGKIVALNVLEYRAHWHPVIAEENIQDLYIKDGVDEYDIHGFDELGRKKHIRFKCQKRE